MTESGATSLLVVVLMSKLFTPQARMLAAFAGSSSWLVVLLSGLPGLVGYWGLSALLNRFPGLSLAQITLRVFGKGAGRIAGMAYPIYFIVLAGFMLRQFVAGFRVAVLPTTPISVIAAGILAVALYASLKKLEVLGRLGSYLVPVMTVLFVLAMIGTVRHANWRHLTPFFGAGVAPTLLLPLPLSSLHGEILALGVLAPLLPSASVGRLGFTAIVLGLIGQVLILATIGATFPYPALSRLFYPILELTRLIEVSEFVQRIEALFIFLWFFMGALTVSLLISSAAATIRDLSETKYDGPLLLGAGLIIYAIAFIPVNQVELVWLDWMSLRQWGWTISFLLPALTLLVAAVRGKRGTDSGTPATQAG